jgi:hypothetical protein
LPLPSVWDGARSIAAPPVDGDSDHAIGLFAMSRDPSQESTLRSMRAVELPSAGTVAGLAVSVTPGQRSTR